MRDISNDTLAYEGVQRIFRNAVVRHMRETLRPRFGGDEESRLKKPFKPEQWNRAVAEADLARKAGFVTREAIDPFDQLDVSHFLNLFDAYFEDIVPDNELPSREYVPKVRQQVQSWLREIAGVRNPISHPPEVDLPVPDLLRVLDSALRLLRLLGCRVEADELQQVYGEALDRAIMSGPRIPNLKIESTLPPSETVVVDFVGRASELRSLWRWLLDPRAGRWMLSGDGGKGKSSIAYEFASAVAASPPDDLVGVFWLSAKRRRFGEGEVVLSDQPDFWDLDSALSCLLRAFGESDHSAQTLDAKRTTLLGLMGELPVLIVVDDLDSIPAEHDDVVDFFSIDAPGNSKVLVTSRRQFPGYGKTKTVVRGLEGKEALEFINSRIKLMDLPGGQVDTSTASRIVEICEGSPLYMEDLLRLARAVSLKKAMDLWRDKKGDEARKYALRREVEMLSDLAKEVLYVLALSPDPLSVIEVAHVLGWTEDRIIDAMAELERMYLVPASELVEGVPRFQLNQNLTRLIRQELAHNRSEASKIRTAIRAVSGEDTLGGNAHTIAAFIRQAVAHSRSGRHDVAETTLLTALDQFPNQPAIYERLGWVYKFSNPQRVVDAREQWTRAYQLGSMATAMYREWITMEIEVKEWDKAAVVAERWLQRVDSNHPEALRLGGYARSRLGQELEREGEQVWANTELRQADGMLSRALALTGSRARELDRSRAYRAWVRNGQVRERVDREGLLVPTVLNRSLEWLRVLPRDPRARENAERMSSQWPELRAELEKLRVA